MTDYEGSKLRESFEFDYASIDIPLAFSEAGSERTFKKILGALNMRYLIVENTSSLKIWANYKDALNKAGFNVKYQCKLSECGDEEQAEALGNSVSVEQVYNYYGAPYYIVASKEGVNGLVWLAAFIGGYESKVAIQQIIAEEIQLQTGLVSIDSAYLESKAKPEPLANLDTPKNDKDHSLLRRYPTAKLRNNSSAEYEKITVPLVDGELSLTGDLDKHYYIIKHVSSLKVFRNYEHALKQEGFEVIAHCELEQCGYESQIQALGNGISLEQVYNYYNNPYYILAKKESFYVGLFVGANEDTVAVQQIIIETKALETGLVEISADGLKNDLDEKGKALIYGIYFDTDKASIKPESKPSLDAIAELLKKHPELALYVVGHTDDTGKMDHNIQLAQQRADAVVATLSNQYHIEQNRLLAKGVGSFAPASNNTSDSGKQLNRRVELVKRLNR
ncbi:MAG: OmpA family protein [Alteromonadales bacterium]|nr:OmpA family protein [Alteromonadales bacterium]